MPTALGTYALTTLANFREFIKDSSTTSISDNAAERIINRASQVIERYCGRRLKSETYTDEYHDADGESGVVFLDQYPITSVTSLYDDADRTFTSSFLIAATDYMIYPDEAMIRLYNNRSLFGKGYRSIKATYVAGYNATSHQRELDSLEDCCLFIAAWMLKEAPQGDNRLGLGGKNIGNGQVQGFVHSLPPSIRETLDSFKRIAIL